MLLGVRPLVAVAGVNSFVYATRWEGRAGEARDLYLQLVDLDQHPVPADPTLRGLRYAPAAGSTLQVTLLNLDSNKTLVRTAIQPFAGDASIWRVSLLASDPVNGTVNFKFVLTESGVAKIAGLPAGLNIIPVQEVV